MGGGAVEQAAGERVGGRLDLSVVLDQVAEYVFLLRAEGERFRCTMVNQAVLDLSKVPREYFEGRFVDEIPPLPAARRLLTHYRAAMSGWAPVRFEEALQSPLGTVWVEITVTPFRAPDGEVHLLGVGRDVTKRRQAEDGLRESHHRISEILESISDGFYAFDEQWRFTYVNDSAERLLGRRREELLGRTAWEAYPESVGTPFQERYRRAVEEGRPAVFEEYYPPPLDTWYAIRAYPGPHGLSVYFRDIGEERRLEERLRQAAQMEALGRLAGGVAHDFNNLLSSIRGYSEMAGERAGGDPVLRDWLGEVRAAADRGAELVQRLLAFTRQQVPVSRAADVREVVQRAQRLLLPLLGQAVLLEVDVELGLPPVPLDPAQLEQALVNLAVNARDAMPDGGRLSVTAVLREAGAAELPPDLAGPGPWVELVVADDGVGMDAVTRARVFEPFFTTKGPGQGTGLGLSTVYGLVVQAGGAVTVESEPGAGATFRLLLPADDGSPSGEPATVRERPLPGGTETVLVVEDDPAVRRLLVQSLEAQGYRVRCAAHAAEALELAEREPDLHALVSDVVMPGMDGPSLAARLRTQRPSLRVLLISGFSPEGWPDGLDGHQGVRFLQKPFGLRELADTLREVLDG